MFNLRYPYTSKDKHTSLSDIPIVSYGYGINLLSVLWPSHPQTCVSISILPRGYFRFARLAYLAGNIIVEIYMVLYSISNHLYMPYHGIPIPIW